MDNSYYQHIDQAVSCIRAGGVIIYPTESMFGLGCDAFNQQAVNKILAFKQRSHSQGLITVAANIDQVKAITTGLTGEDYEKLDKLWPDNLTWLLPKSPIVPGWISGKHETIAVRIPDHRVPRDICKLFANPIVSTSANISGQSPYKTIEDANKLAELGYVVPISPGSYQQASTIRDFFTKTSYR